MTATCVICNKEIPLLPLGQSRKICRTGDCRRLYTQRKNREWRAAHPDEVKEQNRRGNAKRTRHGKTREYPAGTRFAIECKGCKVTFSVVPSRRAKATYCTDDCYMTHRPSPVPPKRAPGDWHPPALPERACDVCGETYAPRAPRQRACSESCSKHNSRISQRTWAATPEAQERIKAYRSPEWQALRALKRAQRAALLQPTDERPQQSRAECLWCGDDLVALGELYCSDECQWDDAAERQRGAS